MIGIVICCHGKMGDGVRHAAEMIVPRQKQLEVVSVDPADSGESILAALQKAIGDTDDGDGVLLLTDLFGGTPTNISCALLKESKIEIITGFNLPVLIKALVTRDDERDLISLAKTASEYGRRHILIAGELLKKGDK
jgi:PTS system mannose-specific IIA component